MELKRPFELVTSTFGPNRWSTRPVELVTSPTGPNLGLKRPFELGEDLDGKRTGACHQTESYENRSESHTANPNPKVMQGIHPKQPQIIPITGMGSSTVAGRAKRRQPTTIPITVDKHPGPSELVSPLFVVVVGVFFPVMVKWTVFCPAKRPQPRKRTVAWPGPSLSR